MPMSLSSHRRISSLLQPRYRITQLSILRENRNLEPRTSPFFKSHSSATVQLRGVVIGVHERVVDRPF